MSSIQYHGHSAVHPSVSGYREALGSGLSEDQKAEISLASTGDNTGSHAETGDWLVMEFEAAEHELFESGEPVVFDFNFPPFDAAEQDSGFPFYQPLETAEETP